MIPQKWATWWGHDAVGSFCMLEPLLISSSMPSLVSSFSLVSQLKNREFALCFDGQRHNSHGCRWSRNQCPKVLKSDKTNSTLSMSSCSGVTPEVKVSCVKLCQGGWVGARRHAGNDRHCDLRTKPHRDTDFPVDNRQAFPQHTLETSGMHAQDNVVRLNDRIEVTAKHHEHNRNIQ